MAPDQGGFRLRLTGELLPGRDFAEVQSSLAQLFRAAPGPVARLLREGGVLPQRFDEAGAARWRERIEAAGARCRVEAVTELTLAPAGDGQPQDWAAPPPATETPSRPLRRPAPPAEAAAAPLGRGAVGLLAAAGLLCIGLSLWRADTLPGKEAIVAELAQEPRQEAVALEPFRTTVGGVDYTVRPLFEYELRGLVVSRHDSETWWDAIHADSHDHLNAMDLCVVWGRNADPDLLAQVAFSSGEFTCYFQTASEKAWRAFDPARFSNNHLLTADARTARALREVRIGDQILVRGHLAEYSHHHGFPFRRGTSTVRTDRGNGACETIYVSEFRLLRAASRLWDAVWWLGLASLAAAAWFWWRLPARLG